MKKLLVLLSLFLIFALWGCDMLDDALDDEPTEQNPPLRPSELELNLTQYNAIRLIWHDNSSIEDGFIVQVKINNDAWEEAGEVSRNRSSFTYDEVFENNSYIFRVKAFNEAGDSDWYTSSTLSIPIFPPTSLSGYGEDENIILEWEDNSSVEDGYKIERRLATGGNWDSPVSVDEDDVTYTDETAEPDVEYEYRIRAYVGTDYSEYSNNVTVSTASIPVDVNAPTNLIADPDETQINLSWTDNSDNEDGFIIERMSSDESWDVIETTNAGTSTYDDNNVVTDVEYSYRVRAFAGSSSSTYSNVASATIASVPVEVDAPSNLTASATETVINLSWTDNSDNEEGFTIERMAGDDNWTVIEITAPDITAFEDDDVTTDIEYSYRVKGFAGGSNSTYSNVASATIVSGPSEIEAPSNLHGDAFETGFDLFWEDNSTNETGFHVQRSQGAGWSTVATLGRNAITYVDENVESLENYSYRVQAFGEDDNVSDFSNTIQLQVPFFAPTNAAATYIEGNGIVRITWQDRSAVETGYEVAARVNGGEWFLWAQLDPNTTQVIDNDITEGDTYDYKVCARNGDVVSAYSNTTTVHIPNGGGNTQVIYSSDFESDTVGDFPAGWSYSLAGVNASVSDENAASGTQSIKFRDPNAPGNGYLIKDINGSGYDYAHVNFKIYFNNTHGTLAITSSDASVMNSFLQFEENGVCFAINGGTNQTIFEDYQLNHWFDVSIQFDMANHVYNIWIDGNHVASNFAMMNDSTGPLRNIKFNMWGDRMLPDGAFVDDVQILYIFND